MSGPQYRKKLEKKWTPVVFDTKEPTYTEPINKRVQWKGITVGGVYGKKPSKFDFENVFRKTKNIGG